VKNDFQRKKKKSEEEPKEESKWEVKNEEVPCL